jgi:hypothetical protein
VHNIGSATQHALEDVKRETEAALHAARKVSEKALEGLAKEIGKHVPKIKIKMKKPDWL